MRWSVCHPHLLHVVLHGDAAEGDGEDAGHMEGLRSEVGEIGEDDDNQWLYHSGMVEKSINISKYCRLDISKFMLTVDLVNSFQSKVNTEPQGSRNLQSV